jgi:hypothetical protein
MGDFGFGGGGQDLTDAHTHSYARVSHGPAETTTLEGHGCGSTPALYISDQGIYHFIPQNSIGTMADPIDSAL